MILLDTVVLSELRKARPSPQVIQWLGQQREQDLFISVVSLGEIERGITKAQKTDPDFAQALSQWLEELMRRYADRILPITPPIARLWGKWSAELGHEGADLLIAATAQVHRLAVATRNAKNFRDIVQSIVDPFKNEP
jgi:toxin FitB